MDTISILLDIENAVTQWLFSATPQTAEDQLQMTKVLAARDRLVASINALVLQRVQVAASNLVAQTQALESLNEKLKSTASTIATAQTVIGIASDVLGITATIASIIAAA